MSKLDKMCYSEFIDYLDSEKIEYQEGEFVDIEKWFDVYVCVRPVGKKLKERYFSTDGGHQLF